MRKGTVVCVVETSKASVEIEAPGDGLLVQLVPAETEVELGSTIAVVAADETEAATAAERKSGGGGEPAPTGPANVTRRAAELAAAARHRSWPRSTRPASSPPPTSRL